MSLPTREEARAALLALAPDLGEQGLAVLSRMYSATHLEGEGGVAEVGNTSISMLQGAVLRQLVQRTGARRTLEVGFAYGFSTVWLLDALPADGSHVAIDPYERKDYAGVGLARVRELAAPATFTWREAPSIHGLTQAIREGEQYDLVFIDGNHRFDDVLVDCTLADPLLRVGGVLALDDLWMPSVRTAASFIATNRAYRPVTQPEANLAAFVKTGPDERDWRHFVPFTVFR